MPVITANSDPVKIAGPGDGTNEYDYRLSGNSVLLARTAETAQDPRSPRRRLRKGDRGKIDREEGETIWAFNDDLAGTGDDATLEMSRTGFFVTFGTRPVVGAVDTGRTDDEAPASSDGESSAHFTAADLTTGDQDLSVALPNAPNEMRIWATDQSSGDFDATVKWVDAPNDTFSDDSDDDIRENTAVPGTGGDDVTVTFSNVSTATDVDARVVVI